MYLGGKAERYLLCFQKGSAISDSTMTGETNRGDYIPPKTVIVPCRELSTGAALGWLKSGWADLRAALKVSLIYGFVVFFLCASVAWLAWALGGFVLLLGVLSGFVFVAPMLAFGLYSVSRQLCEGRTPDLGSTFRAIRRPFSFRPVPHPDLSGDRFCRWLHFCLCQFCGQRIFITDAGQS